MTALESLQMLMDGNKGYVRSSVSKEDISPERRLHTARHGQHPYAIVIACSDSRVMPEAIFSCGIGDLFVIRVAGNVIDNHQLGSVEYAAAHLHTPLVMLLGHTHCGAVDAAIEGIADGYIKTITDEIKLAIGDEKDDYRASCLNVLRNVRLIREAFHEHEELDGIDVVGAMYDIETGQVSLITGLEE